MKVSDAQGIFRETRTELRKARHLPGWIYTAPELYALEKERVFMRDWLCVGRVEEVEKPGDFVTLTIMGEPVIVARDENDSLHALVNMCRHRGVEVAAGKGSTAQFSCPYHGWTYDLAGQLIGSPYMTEASGFDPAQCSLRRLRLGTWRGSIFISFDADAPPLAEFVDDLEREFGFLGPERCRLADRLVVELDCNWKLVVENLTDVYHAQTLHADTLGAFAAPDRRHFKLFEDGGFRMYYDAAPMSPDGKTIFGKMPWLDDIPESFVCSGCIMPNYHFFAYCDVIVPFTVWPLSLERTKIIVDFLYAIEFFDQPDFRAKVGIYTDYIEGVVEEDRSMVVSLQRAMSSSQFDPGRMAAMEGPVHNVITRYVDRVFGQGGDAGGE